jgi:hypothetical protein
MVNQTVHRYFFAARIASAREKIDIFPQHDIAAATSLRLPPMGANPFSDIDGPLQFALQKVSAISRLIATAVSHAASLSQSFVSLCSLYAGEFVIQVLLLPLLTWWVLVRIANAVFDANLPLLIRHRRAEAKVDSPRLGGTGPH